MYECLLKSSLNRISSLMHYFETETKNVERIAEEGMRRHEFGARIENYLRYLAFADDEELKSDRAKEYTKKISKYIKVTGNPVANSASEKKITYQYVKKEYAPKAGNTEEEWNRYHQYKEMPLIHGSASLTMLVTRFEEFVSWYLETLYVQFPEKYLNNQHLTFAEVSGAEFKELKKRLVAREVGSKMRESHKEWFKLYTSHGLSCKSFEGDLDALSEIYARRNLLVHNSGIVNDKYLREAPAPKAKLGESLTVDMAYMRNAFDTVTKIIVLMLIESSKLEKAGEGDCLRAIFRTLFDYLQQGRYNVCKSAYAVLSEKNELDEKTRLMSKFNRWICAIALGELLEKEEIQTFDVSALSDEFKLAKAVLLEDYETTNSLLKKMLRADQWWASAIEKWPLFMWYRTSEAYGALKQELPSVFNVMTFEQERDNDDASCADDSVEARKAPPFEE